MGVPEVPASLRSWMSAVSEIVRSVNAAEPLASVLTRVADQACELIGFEFCAVMLADERRECLQIAGWSGLTPDYLAQVSDGQGLRIRPPGPDLDTPAARAYREDRTIVVPDVREARSYGRLRHLAPTQGYRALLVSPLRGSGDLAGVIVAYSVTAREFSGPELELIELLAGQAAMALETARLRAEQQDVIRELSLTNEEMRRGRAVLEWAERQHHQLMQLVLDEVELPELVAALASALRASVTVEDTDGRVLASAPAEGYCPPPALAARRAGAARAALKAQEASGRRYTVARVPVRGPNGRVTRPTAAWAAPVVVGGELAGRYEGAHVLLLPAEPDPGDALRRILAKADQAVGPRGRLTLVAGPVARDTAGYATAFRVARGAAALRRASGRGGFVDVGRLGLSALLLETGTPEALRRFAADVLHAVAEHEERHGGDLLATLRAWLSAGCSTAAAAGALVVHRNTVTYRLGRIEQLTGRSLRDNRVRLELELALTIREIVQAGTPG